MPISQVILGVQDLDVATRRIESLGLTVVDGGVHPGLGTANRIVPLVDAYLELLAVVDERQARANEFGQALLASTVNGDGLVRWSIRTTDIERTCCRLGLVAERRRRVLPDGSVLTWRAAGLDLSLRDGWLPFFMQWDDEGCFPGSIAVTHDRGDCRLAWLELAPADPAKLDEWIAGEELPVRRVDGPAGLFAVGIATERGEIVIGG